MLVLWVKHVLIRITQCCNSFLSIRKKHKHPRQWNNTHKPTSFAHLATVHLTSGRDKIKNDIDLRAPKFDLPSSQQAMKANREAKEMRPIHTRPSMREKCHCDHLTSCQARTQHYILIMVIKPYSIPLAVLKPLQTSAQRQWCLLTAVMIKNLHPCVYPFIAIYCFRSYAAFKHQLTCLTYMFL